MRRARAAVMPSNRTHTTDRRSHARLITLAERLGPDEMAVLELAQLPQVKGLSLGFSAT